MENGINRFKEISNTIGKTNSGFYYDAQLNDPYLSLSLHPNTVRDESEEDGWGKPKGPTLERTTEQGDEEDWDCYSATPIARAIMTEDLMYSIVNNFTDINMGNPLESLFSEFKKYGGILTGANNGVKAFLEGDALGSSVNEMIQGVLGKASPYLGFLDNMSNNSLVVQGTRFSDYNGTSFSFNNMTMKYTVFSDWVSPSEFQTVNEYLEELKLYALGIYHPVTDQELVNETLGNTTGENFRNFVKEHVGYQTPPAGFKKDSGYRNLDLILRGTMRLNIGGRYALNNLVIKNMNVSLSKVQAKHPKRPGETIPMYADIELQLAPACVVTDKSYSNLISGKGFETTLMTPMTTYYSTELEKLKNSIKSKIIE